MPRSMPSSRHDPSHVLKSYDSKAPFRIAHPSRGHALKPTLMVALLVDQLGGSGPVCLVLDTTCRIADTGEVK